MSFPQIVSANTSSQGSNTLSHTVNMPSSPVAGNRITLMFAVDGGSNTVITWPAPFATNVIFRGNSGTSVAVEIAETEATGLEGSTITVVTNNTEQSAHLAYQISGHDPAQASEVAGGSSNDPPSLTPTGGAKDYLWITGIAPNDGVAGIITGFPANYINTGQVNNGTSGSAGASLAYATRELNAASENPGAFTESPDPVDVNFTLAVHPAAAVPPDFETNPSVTATSDEGNTVSFESDADATAYLFAYAKDSTAPTDLADALAGALDAWSTAVTASTPDTLVSTGLDFPIHDYYVILDNAGGESAPYALVDIDKDPPTGKQYVVVDVPWDAEDESILDGASPAAVDGDIIEIDTLSSGSYAITCEDDGTFVIASGGDTSRQDFDARFYDVSIAAWSDDPAVTFYVNSQAPTLVDPEDPVVYYAVVDEVSDAVDLLLLATDPQGDTLEVSFPDEALPTGLSESAGVVTGTPTVRGGTYVTVRYTNLAAQYVDGSVLFGVGDLVEDYETDDFETTKTALELLGWVVIGSPHYSSSIAAGAITGQSEAVGTILIPGDEITLFYSSGPAPGGISFGGLSDHRIYSGLSVNTGLSESSS